FNSGIAVADQLGHIGVGLGVGGGGNQAVLQGVGGLVVHHNAHVGQGGAGGDDLGAVDHIAVGAGGGGDVAGGGVAVAVDEQVNAVHVLAHVDGAVADALVGNTQVAQAD